MSENLPALFHYDAACRALAEAVRVDEVKGIFDVAVAMRVYAKQANNRNAEADAVGLRLRATRRLGEIIEAQKQTVGLAKGGKPYQGKSTGLAKNPVATLADAGINKSLAHQARTLVALSDEKFEALLVDTHDKVARAARNAVRDIEIEQERESYRDRIEHGATVEDLEALVSAGKRFGVIYPDPAWSFEVYSGKGKQRSAERHYDTWPLERIKTLPVQALAANDCALLMWAVWPN
jgi:hypothetical protein